MLFFNLALFVCNYNKVVGNLHEKALTDYGKLMSRIHKCVA